LCHENTDPFFRKHNYTQSMMLTATIKIRSHLGVTNGEVKHRNFDFYEMT